jgi:hypothetical protein
MYNESRDRNREGWKFTYKGSELLAAAEKRVKHFSALEKDLRDQLSKRLADRSKNLTSSKNDELKSRATMAATLREQCEVFAHEFERLPEREFYLSIGDVVFFGLAGHELLGEKESDE